MTTTDPIEVSLGICMYLSPNTNGFSAVSKARYSDFIVHEVAVDGHVARLTCMEPVIMNDVEETKEGNIQSEISLKRQWDSEQSDVGVNASKNTSGKESAAIVDDETIPPTKKHRTEEAELLIWKDVQAALCGFTDEDTASKVRQFLQRNFSSEHEIAASVENVNAEEGIDYILLPAIKEKETRKQLHILIRERLSKIGPVAADTIANGCIRIWRSQSFSKMPKAFDCNPRHGTNSQTSYSGDRKRYLQFVMYKENMDTSVAIQQITRCLGTRDRGFGGRNSGKPGRKGEFKIRIGYAGNKDKRGVTCQFVTIPSTNDMNRISTLCRNFNDYQHNNPNTISETSRPYGAGGGHTTSGGVGVLRVGNFRYANEELKLGRLYGNRFDVVLRNVEIGDEKTNEKLVTQKSDKIRMRLEQAAESIRVHGFINYFGIQRFGKFHDTHLTGIAILQGDYERAIDIIMSPKSDEKESITAARVMWKNRFESINNDKTVDHKQKASIEKDYATRAVSAMNRFMLSETSILNSLIRFPLDYKRAFLCITKTMRMMFIHAFQSYVWNQVVSYRIEDLGLKVSVGDLVLFNGSDVEQNTNQLPAVHVVTSEDVASNKFTIFDVVLPLIGMKTKIPENRSGTLFGEILGKHGISLDMIHGMDREYNCTGDYRKVVCQPHSIDFRILEYFDELEPLVQTDYMSLQNIKISRNDAITTGSKQPMDDFKEEQVEPSTDDRSNSKSKLYAMVIAFTLPSSSYATIFLRELMKRPTSSEYQKEQKLRNDESFDVP